MSDIEGRWGTVSYDTSGNGLYCVGSCSCGAWAANTGSLDSLKTAALAHVEAHHSPFPLSWFEDYDESPRCTEPNCMRPSRSLKGGPCNPCRSRLNRARRMAQAAA